MKKSRHSLVRRIGAGILTALMLLSSTAFAETATETISTTKNIQWDGSYEVVIVGAGGAGLGAACTAGEAGVKTLVIEQEVSETHSNTAYSGGTFMAAETSLQKEKGIVDSKEGWRKFIDCMTLGKAYDDIIDIWVEDANVVFDWLYQDVGVAFDNVWVDDQSKFYEDVTPCVPRGHTTYTDSGVPIVRGMYDYAAERGVEFLFSTRAERLIQDADGRVIGVQTDHCNYRASRGVILATGGFSKNKDMMSAYQPNIAGSGTSVKQDGQGILMGQYIGAKLGNMWVPQCDIVGVYLSDDDMRCLNTCTICRTHFQVGTDGLRHFREDLYYEQAAWEVEKLPGGYGWAVWDQVETDLGTGIGMPWCSKGYEDEIASGAIKKADTIEELATLMGFEGEAYDNLVSTFYRYQSFCEKGVDEDFGRVKDLEVLQAPFYACKVETCILDTAGGLVTVADTTQVVDLWDEPIPGLYAAGMMVAGYRGEMYTGGGTSVSMAITFGRRAGEHAAANAPDANVIELFSAENALVGPSPAADETGEAEIVGELHDGTFVGVGSGQGGLIYVTIEVKDGVFTITDISPNNETQGLPGYSAIEDGTYKSMFETAQSQDIDNISSATVTTEALKTAVKSAMNKSRVAQ